MRLDQLKNPAIREQATRQVSRQLGAGNGPTVQPSVLADKIVTRWFRTASQGRAIVEAEVTNTGKDWLDIVTSSGAIQRTRTDGADSYWPTRQEAAQAVERRLYVAMRQATLEHADFLIAEAARQS